MPRIILFSAFCCFLAGCTAADGDNGKASKDAHPVYEAVLKVELKEAKNGEGYYLFVDGKDPEPDLLTRLQKHWPQLQPGSKVPEGKATRINVGELR
jgi:hypothetical protein